MLIIVDIAATNANRVDADAHVAVDNSTIIGSGTVSLNSTTQVISNVTAIANTDTGSVASSSKSDQMIIKKNVSYTVQYEDAHPPPENTKQRPSPTHTSSGRHSQQDLHNQFAFHDYEQSQTPRRKGNTSNIGVGM